MSWAKRFWPELPAWWPPVFAGAVLLWAGGLAWDAHWHTQVPMVFLIAYHLGAQTGWTRRRVYEDERREERQKEPTA